MPRDKQDIEFIVRYEPDMECEVSALLIVLGYGKARPRADTGTVGEILRQFARDAGGGRQRCPDVAMPLRHTASGASPTYDGFAGSLTV